MKLKVLMLPKWYPSYIDTAEGNYVERHIKAISTLTDVDVAVLYVHSDKKMGTNGCQTCFAEEQGFPVVRVFFKRAASGISVFDKATNLYRYLKAQRAGYRVLKEKFGIPDITHVHVLTRTALLAAYLKWTRSIPFVITEHWSGFLEESKAYTGGMRWLPARWLTWLSSGITCVSDAQKRGMQNCGFRGNFIVVPNVVDTELFKPCEPVLNATTKKIIHISRLDSHPKNLPGILRAIKKLAELRGDFELHLLGDGIEASKQKQLVRELNLTDKVFFHGYNSQQVVADMLAGALFLLMFSNYETQSCAILEAFACGVPVIATKVGGISEIMDNSRGVLVEKGDERNLMLEINKMLDDHNRFNQQEIRDFAVNNFSRQQVAAQFLQVYMHAFE